MLFLFYNVLIESYFLLIKLASPFNKKAKAFTQGRLRQLHKIKEWRKAYPDKKLFWIHAASYGEFEMARPIFQKIRDEINDSILVISFFSPSGFEHTHFEDHEVIKIYFPKDRIGIMQQYLKLLNPVHVIFIKYEFWFNFLRVARSLSIPYSFTSLNLYKNHYLFNPMVKPFLDLLKQAHKIFCILPESADMLKENGFKNIDTIGDSRIPQVLENKAKEISFNGFNNKDAKCICYGSVSLLELDWVLKFIEGTPHFNHILALHDLDSHILAKISKRLNGEVSLFSEKTKREYKNVLLIDTYGDLRYLYRFANVAFIGGGFEKGPHNVLEPLVYGTPTCTGPNIKKFPITQKLVNNDLVYLIKSPQEFMERLILLVEKVDFNNFKIKAKYFIENHDFAIEKVINELK